MKYDESIDESEAVIKTLNNYILGYVTKDTGLLRQTFSSNAALITLEEGEVTTLSAVDWFAKLDERKRLGMPATELTSDILGFEQNGAVALIRIKLTFQTYSFMEYHTLLKTHSGWRIVNKTYVQSE